MAEVEILTLISIAIFETFVQHSVGRLVPSQRLFGQVLVGLGQTFHLSETSVESHGWVTGVLGHIQVSRPPQLLLNNQSLLQQLQREIGEEKQSMKHRCDRQREIHFVSVCIQI